MKPCSANRQLLGLLALNAVDARQEQNLRTHLESCEACRRYLEELSTLVGQMAAVEVRADIQTSEFFHRRVAKALRAEPPHSAWVSALMRLRETLLTRRIALPALGALAAMIVVLGVLAPRPLPRWAPVGVQPGAAHITKVDLDPTIFNYQMVANQSLEKLDDLLTNQGNRNPSPTLIYTASALARANTPD